MSQNNYTLIFFIITFWCNSTILNSQSIDQRLDENISKYEHMLKTGSRKNQDSILTTFKNIKEQTKPTSIQNIKATVYTARMLSGKRNFKEAATLINEAKTAYNQALINDQKILHAIAYYDLYLDVQVKRAYNEDKIKTYYETFKDQPGNDPFIEALSYEYRGRIHQDWGEYKLSIVKLTKAIELFSELGYIDHVSAAYGIMGGNYDYLENFEMASKYAEKSIQVAKQLEEPNLNNLAVTSFNLSLLYGDRLGNYQKGLFYALEAIKYDKEEGGEENPYLALDYNQAATTYMNLGDFTKAQIYGEKGLEHARLYFKKPPQKISESLRTLGYIYAQTGRKEEAISLGEEALNIVLEVVPENHHWVCASYLNLANTYKKLGMFPEAEMYYLKTERVATAIDRDLFLIDVYHNLPEIYYLSNKTNKIPSILEKATVLLNDKFKDADYYQRRNEMNTIVYYESTQDTLKAKQALNAIKEKINQKHTYPDIELKIHAYELLLNNNTIDAYENFLKTLTDHKNKFPNQFNKIMHGNNIKELLGKIISKLYKKIEKEDSEGLKKLLFKYLEINKNSVLLEGIQGTRFKKIANIPDRLLYEETNLLDSLQLNHKRIYNAKQSKYKDVDKLQKLYDQQISFEKSYDSLQLFINTSYPKLKRLKYLSVQKDFNDFASNYIGEDGAIITYFLDNENWYRFTITKHKSHIEQFTTSKELKEAISELLTSISKQKFDTTLSHQLHKSLLPTLPEKITKLTFITDGILSIFPFEVLQQKDKYLIENYTISYAGSLQLLEEQINLNNKGENWLGFAPHYEKNTLPNNIREVEEIEKITNGTSYLGKDATKANFISNSSNYNILHLATHTEIDQKNPFYNKMLFSEKGIDSTLTASEIYTLNLNANLAVLSSCNTGFGKLEKGEGIMSMSRAFTYAGVSSTLMTLWKVPDQETSKITAYFYTNLESGMTKDKALQEAKRSYLNTTTDVALKQPYYWAGFILSGDTSPIKNHSNEWWWYLLGGLILVILLYTLSRKRT